MKISILWAYSDRLNIPDNFAQSEYRKVHTGEKSLRAGAAAEYLLYQLLIQRGIKTEAPLDIRCGEFGKPYINGMPLKFNISHTGNIAVCAVCDCELGVDIQSPKTISRRLIDKYFSPAEQSAVNRAEDPARAATEIWCAKESYVKASGQGIARGISSAMLELNPGADIRCNGYRIYMGEICGCPLSCCALTEENLELEIREYIS